MARRSNAARRDASAARRREGIRSQPLRAERRGVLQVAGAALLWSLGGIGIKAIAEPPLKIAAYRSATAAVALFLLFRPKLAGRGPGFFAASACCAACLTTFVVATKWTTAANAVFLIRNLDAHPGAGRLFVPRAAVWRPDWHTWLEPDLFLVTAERLRTTDAGRLDTADLVVEALSAGSATYDRTAKADTYAALGVRERWLVDLERRAIEQRVLEAGRWRVAGVHAGSVAFEAAVFPGLTVVPEDAFAPA